MAALKKLVYDDKEVALDTMKEALKDNFGFKSARDIGSFSLMDQEKKENKESMSYLQEDGGRKGIFKWILSTDHKRIGLLYLYSMMSWFIIGVVLGLGNLAAQFELDALRLAGCSPRRRRSITRRRGHS